MHDEELRWDDLKVLLAVLRAGSFTAAAGSLRVEQSTVSRRIAGLEASLGVLLFDRHRSGPTPTEAAEAMREGLERLEAGVRILVDGAQTRDPEVHGRVRLALTESIAVHAIIPHLLGPLRERYPRLHVDLVVGDQVSDLARREADLAIRFFRPKDDDLVAKRVARIRTSVLAHRSYRRLSCVEPAALDWILYEVPGVDTPEERFLREFVGATPAMRTTGYLAQVEAVRAGLGVAMLARSLMRLDPDLVEIPLPLPPGPTLELWLTCPKSLRRVPRVDVVFAALEEGLPAISA